MTRYSFGLITLPPAMPTENNVLTRPQRRMHCGLPTNLKKKSWSSAQKTSLDLSLNPSSVPRWAQYHRNPVIFSAFGKSVIDTEFF